MRALNVVVIGTEERLLEEGSRARASAKMYGSIANELHIIIFSNKSVPVALPPIAPNVFLYTTQSSFRLKAPFDAWFLARSLRTKHIQLVSSQDPFECGVAGLLSALSLKAALHIQIHTDFLSPFFWSESLKNKLRVIIARFILPRADGIRVVANRIRDSLGASSLKLKATPIVLPIRAEIEQLLILSRDSFLQDKYPQHTSFILMVSRLSREKNITLALRAFAAIHTMFPDAGLIIVGDGEEYEILRKAVTALKLQTAVHFEGWQGNLAPYYGSASLFLSTSDYEGYGLSLIEAGASGVPIVSTDVGIAREIFGIDGASIVPVRDEASLILALTENIRDKEKTSLKASIARERVSAHMKSEKEYLESYRMAWEASL